MKRKYKVVIAYDGTAYSGWQYQENAVGIQQVVEEVLAYLARQRAYRLLGRRQRDSLAVVKPARELSFFDDRGEVGGLERGFCFFFYK